jgi:hypothetical protein
VRHKLFALLIAAFLLTSITAVAHHSFAATYLEDKTEKIEGKISVLIYRNPHSFVQVDVKDDKGKIQTWAIEWGDASQLNLTGGMEAIKPGDPVVVIGNPGRNPADHRMRMVSITRTSDGWKWGGTFQ